MAHKKTASPGGLTLSAFIGYCGGASSVPPQIASHTIRSVQNDSRSVKSGDVFVALATDNDDGHRYVHGALLQGALAAVVAKKKLSMFSEEDKTRLIAVADPLAALQRAASRYRKNLPCAMVGITGSNGKTTTRHFISAVCRQTMAVGETQGNFNNHIGVPLTLLGFSGMEALGVLEIGANHAREIHTLSGIVRPDIGVITNIGYAHIGYFGSLANIAKAKFEIVDGMKKKGVLLLNGDDPLLVKKSARLKQEVVFFGTTKRCHVRATGVRMTPDRRIGFIVDNEEYVLPLSGRHFVYPALAAISIARRFGVDKKHIDAAFSTMQPLSMRGTIEEAFGATFIVDCYNANPSSMKSAIAMLQDIAASGPKAAIVGDMLELGKHAGRLHAALGRQLAAARVERIVAVGEYGGAIAKAAIAAGLKSKNVASAKIALDAAPLAKALIKAKDTVLVKGSRGVRLEAVLGVFGLGPAVRRQAAGLSRPKSFVPKKATVIGAARSGIASAKFLAHKGIGVFISDSCQKDRLEKILADNGLSGIPHEAGGHTDAVLDSDVIILSPGVPSDIPILKKASERHIPVWSEIELAYRSTGATFLAITGSSGKSTTTAMLGAILSAAEKPHRVAGNIGIPLISVVEGLSKDAFVAAEVSSFQLETIDLFRPHAAAVLNLMKNHLDRYESEEAYYNAKKRIAANLTVENYLVVNRRDRRLEAWASEMKRRTNIVWFGQAAPGDPGVWHEDGVLWSSIGGTVRPLLAVKDMRLSGPHNWDNACAAAALAATAGIRWEDIAQGITGFSGLEHRLEYVAEINGVKYYNDSKSTTAESVLCAMTAFGRNVHLIAGGRDKGCDFSIVDGAIGANARGVYLIGEASGRMAGQWQGLAPVKRYDSLSAALTAAAGNAVPGDVVVLSPGCSSFDMFDDYEHRGEAFKALVRGLSEGRQ
jgi:UDP-N-acetylmuramoylalanine--D-glutamate ligase